MAQVRRIYIYEREYFIFPQLIFSFQVDYGNCESLTNPKHTAKNAVRRFCPMRYTKMILPHDLESVTNTSCCHLIDMFHTLLFSLQCYE